METLNSLNQQIAQKTAELKNISTASGYYGTLWNERAELIRKRDALLKGQHEPART